MSDTAEKIYQDLLSMRLRLTLYKRAHRQELEATVHRRMAASGLGMDAVMLNGIEDALDGLDQAVDVYEAVNELGVYSPDCGDDAFRSYEDQNRQRMGDVL
jgi:hypothetical protein